MVAHPWWSPGGSASCTSISMAVVVRGTPSLVALSCSVALSSLIRRDVSGPRVARGPCPASPSVASSDDLRREFRLCCCIAILHALRHCCSCDADDAQVEPSTCSCSPGDAGALACAARASAVAASWAAVYLSAMISESLRSKSRERSADCDCDASTTADAGSVADTTSCVAHGWSPAVDDVSVGDTDHSTS